MESGEAGLIQIVPPPAEHINSSFLTPNSPHGIAVGKRLQFSGEFGMVERKSRKRRGTMILMACVDGRNGMAFNRRRQSRDRAVRADLLAEIGTARLWVNAATARQFAPEEQSRLCVDASFLEKAGPGEPCFVENCSVVACAGRVEQVVLYRWDRAYPADLFWDLPLEGWTLARREEFPGFSHEIITKEVYIP